MRLALLELYERIRQGDYDPVEMMRVAEMRNRPKPNFASGSGMGVYQRQIDQMIELVQRDLQVADPVWEEDRGAICGGDIQRAALVTIVRGKAVF